MPVPKAPKFESFAHDIMKNLYSSFPCHHDELSGIVNTQRVKF